MARLKDIAEEAGVSIRTVSRVLKGEPHISRDKINLVQEAVKKLNYTPNILARGLKTKKTQLLGIITEDMAPQVTSKKISAIQYEAASLGFQTLLGLTGRDKQKEANLINVFKQICDGFLFLHRPQEQNLEILQDIKKPFVLADCQSDLPSVFIDRRVGIREAFSQVSKRYKNYIFLTASTNEREERRASFEQCVSEKVGKINTKILYTQPITFEGGYKCGDSISHISPALVVCYNDQLASGLLKRMYELNVNIPKDIGIIGFDNDDYTEYSYKSLSSIHQSVRELAEKSLAIFQSFFSGQKEKIFDMVKTHFISRQTTILE